MFEGDYPHSDSNFPASREKLASVLSEIPDDEARKIAEDNARRVFNFPARRPAGDPRSPQPNRVSHTGRASTGNREGLLEEIVRGVGHDWAATTELRSCGRSIGSGSGHMWSQQRRR